MNLRALAAALFLALVAAPALAVEPDEILADPALEARAREISEGLRCLVCQNQSIDDSAAPLARDLRLLVRQQLKEGKSDAAVVQYIVDRYGEFVLLRPRLTPHNYVLWAAPAVLLVAGVAVIVVLFRRREGADTAPLSEAERALLTQVTAELDGRPGPAA